MEEVVAKTQSKEFVDFVYNVSHIWSQRHPERAKEVFSPDVVLLGVGTKDPVKGLEVVEQIFYAMHDLIEDFHYTITSINHEGELNGECTIVIGYLMTGAKIVGLFGDMKETSNLPAEIHGLCIGKAVKRKIIAMTNYTDMARSTPTALKTIMSMHM